MSELKKALEELRTNTTTLEASEKYGKLDKEYDEVVAVLERRLKDSDNASWEEVLLLNNIGSELLDAAEEEGFKAGFLKGVEIGAGKIVAAMVAGGAI